MDIENKIQSVYFQINESEPIQFAYTTNGTFTLTLKSVSGIDPEVEFSDGRGNRFKLFIKTDEF